MWSDRKNTTTLQRKRRAKLFKSRFHKSTEKYATFSRKYALFHFLFTFLFWLSTMIFEKNVYTGENLKKAWTFAPGFLEYFSAIFSRYFLLGRWTKTPAALQVKTNKLLWWGKTIPTQKWLDKMCMLENYVAYINANNFAYDFSALDLQYLIPCVCSIKHTAQQKLCICS